MSDGRSRTVLVLEDNDMQLTIPARVYDILDGLEPEFNNWPDETYLLSTIVENPWWVHALRAWAICDSYGMSETGKA